MPPATNKTDTDGIKELPTETLPTDDTLNYRCVTKATIDADWIGVGIHLQCKCIFEWVRIPPIW